MEFKANKNTNYDAEITLDSEESNVVYCYPGAVKGGYVDGLEVKFRPPNGAAWLGTFAQGKISPNAITFAGSDPSGSKAIIVSRGSGYIVDVCNPEKWSPIAVEPIMGILYHEELEIIILWDFISMMCIDSDGIRWTTDSISWDGIRNVKVDKGCITLDVWSAPDRCFRNATVQVSNGYVNGAQSPHLK